MRSVVEARESVKKHRLLSGLHAPASHTRWLVVVLALVAAIVIGQQPEMASRVIGGLAPGSDEPGQPKTVALSTRAGGLEDLVAYAEIVFVGTLAGVEDITYSAVSPVDPPISTDRVERLYTFTGVEMIAGTSPSGDRATVYATKRVIMPAAVIMTDGPVTFRGWAPDAVVGSRVLVFANPYAPPDRSTAYALAAPGSLVLLGEGDTLKDLNDAGADDQPEFSLSNRRHSEVRTLARDAAQRSGSMAAERPVAPSDQLVARGLAFDALLASSGVAARDARAVEDLAKQLGLTGPQIGDPAVCVKFQTVLWDLHGLDVDLICAW